MYLHLHLPGFPAVVHQLHEPALRRRPVAVAVSTADSAPLIAVSHEAWAAGVLPSMRLAEARQRCPDLVARLPDADRARRIQAEIATVVTAFSPLVSSRPGRWDVDLDGTEEFWFTRLLPGRQVGNPVAQARLIAEQIRTRLADDLGRAPYIGIGAHPLAARLAARLAAQEPGHSGIALIRPEDEVYAIDPISIHALPVAIPLLDHLVFMGCLTVGAVKRLGLDGLTTLSGVHGRALHAALTGQDQLLPASLDGEAHVSACSGTVAGRADERNVLQLLHGIAQQLGRRLRQRHLAATKLSLAVKWGLGSTKVVSVTPAYQVRTDRDLVHLAECLLVKAGEERLPWAWLRLTATGLVAAEEQHDLFTLSTPPWLRQQSSQTPESSAPLRSLGG